MSREHNNANILALGERVTGVGLAEMIVDVWLHTEFAGGRHERRVEKDYGAGGGRLMNKEELAAEAQRAVEELIEVSGCRAGQVLVVGCSTSEIVGGKSRHLRL
mgnify:CR=1 FL=1